MELSGDTSILFFRFFNMENAKLLKFKLASVFFLEYAVWGSYLMSIGMFLASIGLGSRIGWFFSVQGLAALFMPAICGMVADRLVMPQRLLGICHLLSAAFMSVAAFTCSTGNAGFVHVFVPYSLSVMFFIPTISLANSVCFIQLSRNGMDSSDLFPKLRVWGTVGFVCAMMSVNFLGLSSSWGQLVQRSVLGFVFAALTLFIPDCPVPEGNREVTLRQRLGEGAFSLFREKNMLVFFLLAVLFGICLHISNGFTSPFLDSFTADSSYSDSRFVSNSILVISLSQISEALFVLLIPMSLKLAGVKRVFVLSALAWAGRYLLLAFGNPGDRAWMLLLAMVLYGVAFDFFNITASVFVDRNTSGSMRSSAQGLLLMMTNGIGASMGMVGVQSVVNAFTYSEKIGNRFYTLGDWRTTWLVFAIFAVVLSALVILFFKGGDSSSEPKGK